MKKLIQKLRPFTKREKILLNILVILCIFYLFYKFILGPQISRKESLSLEEIKYNNMIKEQERIIKNKDIIENKWIKLNKKTREIDSYFTNLSQTEILYSLDSIINTEKINLLDIEFSKVYNEFRSDFELNIIGVIISFECEYYGLIDIVTNINNSPKNMIIDNVTIERVEENQFCSIDIKIYNHIKLDKLYKLITEWR